MTPGVFVKWTFLGGVAGAVSATAACLFLLLLGWAEHFFLDFLAGAPPPYPAGERPLLPTTGNPFRPLVFMILPALGGLVSGLLSQFACPEVAGPGTDAMIKAFHKEEGIVRGRLPFLKAIASIATLATNGSAGRQGPLIHVGAGLGSLLAQIIRLGPKDRRVLLLAGASGALAAVFRAPVGAAIIVTELLYHDDIEAEALIPCVISSIVGHTIHQLLWGHEPIFSLPEFQLTMGLGELLWFCLLGLIMVPLGRLYITVYGWFRDSFFAPMPVPFFLKPVIGGALTGVLGLFVPQALGIGYGWLQKAIAGDLSMELMALCGFMKILSTSFSVGSGGSGGIFAPSLFIGGMIGGAMGDLGHLLKPDVILDPRPFVLVGMGGFFAGVAHAPIGSILMVCEMTGGYSLLLPLLAVATVHCLLNRTRSIYGSQVRNRFLSPAHEGELVVNLLGRIKVAEALPQRRKAIIFTEDMTLKAIRNVIVEGEGTDFPVVDSKGHLKGILCFDKVRRVLMEDTLEDLLVAGELVEKPVWVHPDEDLYSALCKFVDTGYEQLPVLSKGPDGEILGSLWHKDLIEAYHSKLAGLRSGQ